MTQTTQSNKQEHLPARPQIQRLKDLGMGIEIERVMGTRVLIEPVKPFTQMDEVEKKGLLYIPDTVKEANEPPPTTGVVVQLGVGLIEDFIARLGEEDLWPLSNGDMVLFSRFAGMDVVIDQGSYKLIEFAEVAAVLRVTNPEAATFVGA